MDSVELSFGTFGQPNHPPLVIMHGLLGSARNWMTLGKQFSENFNVFILDLRNHGDSPHTETMSYTAMVEDLQAWMEHYKPGKIFLLGHSLGGKVAMRYACENPETIHGLIVEDIAPKTYLLRYKQEFEALGALQLETLQTRNQADDFLAQFLKDPLWRQFLLSNLYRKDNGKFAWRVNLPLLAKSLPWIMEDSLAQGMQFSGPTLFLKAENSNFMEPEDTNKIQSYFPKAQIKTIFGAGHNVHVDKPEYVLESVVNFKNSVLLA